MMVVKKKPKSKRLSFMQRVDVIVKTPEYKAWKRKTKAESEAFLRGKRRKRKKV